MDSILKSIPTASDGLRARPTQQLDHLPGTPGHWLTGNMNGLLSNLGPFVREQQALHGNCFTLGLFRNKRVVLMVGTAANEKILLDQEDNFSNLWGWDVLQELFGRNLIVRDFADHRQHRRLMTQAFKPTALANYLRKMNLLISGAIEDYDGVVDVYVQTKRLALDIALEVFAGMPAGCETKELNRDLSTILSNAMAHRIRLPGTRYYRALRSRDRLRHRLAAELKLRRQSNGTDLFSILARQKDPEGRALSDADVLDHMFGMLFAAHDTTASSLSMIFWLLAKNPVWQERLRKQCLALNKQTGSKQLAYEDLSRLPELEWTFKEALRLYAPLQLIPRRVVREFEFEGVRIPANTALYLVPQAVHFDPNHFSNPETFDPERFSQPQRSDSGFAFIPFGKGSHMCLGMHFAHMEIKAVLYSVLLSKQLSVSSSAKADIEYLPIVRPSKPMMVDFKPIEHQPLEEA